MSTSTPNNQSLWFITALLFACTLVTYSAFTLYPAQQRAGEQLLQDTDFTQGIDDENSVWQANYDSGFSVPENTLRVENFADHEVRIARQTYFLPDDAPRILEVSGEVALENIIQGEKGWHSANGVLNFYLGEEKLGSKAVFNQSGSHDFVPFEDVIKVHPRADRAHLDFRIIQTTGVLKVQNPALYPMEATPYFQAMRYTLAACWALLALYYCWRFLRTKRISLPEKLSLAGTLGGLVLLLVLPVTWLDSPLRSLTHALPATFDQALTQLLQFTGHHHIIGSGSELRKLGHGLAFALLGFATLLAFRRFSALPKLCLLLVMVPASETIQLFFSARSFSIADMFIDSLGLAFGVLLAASVIALYNGLTAARPPSP